MFKRPPTRFIVQARSDSSRLPGKALLPVAGWPSAVLAARRAGNRGADIVLATSDRTVDDHLARTAVAAGLRVFRGDSENVRARFLGAAADLPNEAVVVRLTADNMVPDGSLVEEMHDRFLTAGVQYLNGAMLWVNPPHGLGVELMRLGALRSVAAQADTPSDREHVTTTLRDAQRNRLAPQPFPEPRHAGLRCTMDSFDDYAVITRLFEGIADPIAVGWRELLTRLASLPETPPQPTKGAGLVLGTAQLAAPYGSATRVTPPNPAEGSQLIRRAIACGAVAIDTARAYHGSERVIGDALEGGWAGRTAIVTKLAPLAQLSTDSAPELAAAAAEASVFRSLHALGSRVRPTLLLHRAAHLNAFGGAIWQRMLRLREEGLLEALGVSVQSPEELRRALQEPEVTAIQLPLNLLDWRWAEAGVPELLGARRDVRVHVRSVFLQGALLRTDGWPTIRGVRPDQLGATLRQLASELGRRNVADLCVAWVRAQPWVQGVVLGMERLAQLEENVALFAQPALQQGELAEVAARLQAVPEQLLNPAAWPKAAGTDDGAAA